MQVDVKQTLAAALTIGMFVMFLNLIGHGPLSPSSPEEAALMAAVSEELSAERIGKGLVPHDSTPEKLWGELGPVLEPCWKKRIASRQGKTWGFISVLLTNGPQFHAFQVADAVIVARYLGATLLLPTIKEGSKEPNGDFDKIYDVGNFISSLSDVVRVVGRIPDDVRAITPTVIKMPCKVTSEYIKEMVAPILRKNMFIQLKVTTSTLCLRAEGPSDEDMEAIRCLVTYESLKFHPQVQKLGERVVSRVREAGEPSGGRFVAIYLHADALKQKGCVQSDESKRNKKCFDAYDVGTFLKGLGFSSHTAIYLTESRWDRSLDPLKEIFPKVFTKEYSMPFNEERQVLYSGNTQFEKAVDFYVCTKSDVFVPALSGISYVSISGARIAIGKTQILIPTTAAARDSTASTIELSKVLSRFVSKRDHAVYACHCNASYEKVE